MLTVGDKIGNLILTEFSPITRNPRNQKSQKQQNRWYCACSCGDTVRLLEGALLSGTASSCGAACGKPRPLITKATPAFKKAHLLAHESWRHMIYRCYDKLGKDYFYYGWAGVEVDQRWHDFNNFFQDMGDRQTGMSLDRIDPFGKYEKNNCRWATATEQNQNKKFVKLY